MVVLPCLGRMAVLFLRMMDLLTTAILRSCALQNIIASLYVRFRIGFLSFLEFRERDCVRVALAGDYSCDQGHCVPIRPTVDIDVCTKRCHPSHPVKIAFRSSILTVLEGTGDRMESLGQALSVQTSTLGSATRHPAAFCNLPLQLLE